MTCEGKPKLTRNGKQSETFVAFYFFIFFLEKETKSMSITLE